MISGKPVTISLLFSITLIYLLQFVNFFFFIVRSHVEIWLWTTSRNVICIRTHSNYGYKNQLSPSIGSCAYSKANDECHGLFIDRSRNFTDTDIKFYVSLDNHHMYNSYGTHSLF